MPLTLNFSEKHIWPATCSQLTGVEVGSPFLNATVDHSDCLTLSLHALASITCLWAFQFQVLLQQCN